MSFPPVLCEFHSGGGQVGKCPRQHRHFPQPISYRRGGHARRPGARIDRPASRVRAHVLTTLPPLASPAPASRKQGLITMWADVAIRDRRLPRTGRADGGAGAGVILTSTGRQGRGTPAPLRI